MTGQWLWIHHCLSLASSGEGDLCSLVGKTHRDTQRHTETHRDTQRHTETHSSSLDMQYGKHGAKPRRSETTARSNLKGMKRILKRNGIDYRHEAYVIDVDASFDMRDHPGEQTQAGSKRR